MMATSSFFTHVVIRTEEEAERLVAALEASEKDPKRVPSTNIRVLHGADEVRKFLQKAGKVN